MTETEHLKEAIEERDVIAKEVCRLSAHLRKCDDVIAACRQRLERQKFQVSMSLEDVGEREQEPSCVTQM